MKNRGDIIFFILVFLLQLVISDYVHLGPWLFVSLVPFLVVQIRLSRSPQGVMLIAFLVGIMLDILSDGVIGLNAFAAVLCAAPRKFFYRTLVNGDRQDKTEVPSPSLSGAGKYHTYLAAVTAVYMAGYMLLDCAGSRPLTFILVRFVASTLASLALSLILAYALQNRN